MPNNKKQAETKKTAKTKRSGEKSTDNAAKGSTAKSATQKNDAKPADHKPKSKRSSKKSAVHAGTVGLLLIAAVVALCILFDISHVRSAAMMPALNPGDLVLSWTPPGGFGNIDGGEIYFVRYGDSENAPNFMRVIACGDHTISFRDDALRIDSSALLRQPLTNDAIERPPEEPRIWRESIGRTGTSWKIMLPQTPVVSHKEGELKLTAGSCFIAGDNRMSSYDSRQTGALDQNNIRGKALVILKSSKDDGLIGPYIRFL